MGNNIHNMKPEDWFRENWQTFESRFAMDQFLQKNINNFSESFLREFRDIFTADDIILMDSHASFDFIREFKNSTYVNVRFEERQWDEKQLEEFRDNVKWYDMFTHNWNLSNDFIKKWKNEVHGTFDDIIIERNKNRYDNDPEYRKLVNEQIQMLRDIGLDVY